MGKPGIDRLVTVWKVAHLASKPLELALLAARKAVTAAIVASGAGFATTKLGTIPLQTKAVIDWKGLAEKCLKPAVIAAELPSFTKQSEPFVAAPREWAAELKA